MCPAVGLDVVFRRVLGVLDGMHVVTVGEMSVVGCRLGIAFVVMPSGFTMVARRVLVVLGCLTVVMCSFVGHSNSSPFQFVLTAREDYGHAHRLVDYRTTNSG